MAKQMKAFSARFEELEHTVEALAGSISGAVKPRVADGRRRTVGRRPGQAAGKEGTRQEEGRQEEGPGQEGTRPEEGDLVRHRGGRLLGCPQGEHHPSRVTPRRRLDAELVRRGLVASRSEAAGLIDERRVLVNGSVADKPARQVAPGDQLHVAGPPPRFVGRGGLKLDHALDVFGIDVAGLRALDAGASTGGFTDCLLQRGAEHVVAVDVGHGQLHERLRADPRVENIERTNVREIDAGTIGGPVELVVGDLSFISLRLVIAPLVAVCEPGAPMVLLVKPQFEAGRAEVSRGRGVIADPEIWTRVREEVEQALMDAGCVVAGWTDSPITGADGNREFLVHAITPGADVDRRPA